MFNYSKLPSPVRSRIRISLTAHNIEYKKIYEEKNRKNGSDITELHLIEFITKNKNTNHIATRGTVRWFEKLLRGVNEW